LNRGIVDRKVFFVLHSESAEAGQLLFHYMLNLKIYYLSQSSQGPQREIYTESLRGSFFIRISPQSGECFSCFFEKKNQEKEKNSENSVYSSERRERARD
jgi:hypothetical protein